MEEGRFEFGKNWSRFLSVLDDTRIEESTKALRTLLGVDTLAGKTFLDVGSGSGLHSLAAKRLGAARIHSFDYDPNSVACTAELKRRYGAGTEWTVEQGSALEAAYLEKLGTFDVVYSWGVLHHTGDQWKALGLVAPRVAEAGTLAIALYRDQGWKSKAWLGIKRFYNWNAVSKAAAGGLYVGANIAGFAIEDLVRLRDPRRRYEEYKRSRGMSYTHDWIDWVGGLPFEASSPDEVLAFYEERGFKLTRMTTVDGHGCNEYVFARA